MSRYLIKKGHPGCRDRNVAGFPIRQIKFTWQSCGSNVDCGVFLLYHCCAFYGESFESSTLVSVMFYFIIFL